MSTQRRLIAMDGDDLAVVSAHVQDARVAMRDVIWRQQEKRVVLGLHRIDWDEALDGSATPRRLMSALRFDRVLACKARDIDLSDPDASFDLLGIEFHDADPPAGSAILLFSKGMLRLDLECIECELVDFGPDDLVSDGLETPQPSGDLG